MKNIKAIIVDDESHARSALRGILEENFSIVNIMAECANVPDAVKAINTHQPDVVFLDIAMPGYSGFELLEFFETTNPGFQIIFVTAYNEYSMQAFEISAVDYLLKPVRVEQVERALAKLEPGIMLENIPLKVLKENFTSNSKKIVLQTADIIYVVHLSEILYIRAEGSYTCFVTTSHGNIIITKKLIDFEYLENEGPFFRVHRSFIVNLEKIKKVDKKDLNLIMENNDNINLSNDKKNQLLEKLNA